MVGPPVGFDFLGFHPELVGRQCADPEGIEGKCPANDRADASTAKKGEDPG
jgi:hypothetical protein